MDTSVKESLYRDPELALFYDRENRWDADFDFCMALAGDAASVLDLGCGTGELAAALARDRAVTGIDPNAAFCHSAAHLTNRVQMNALCDSRNFDYRLHQT